MFTPNVDGLISSIDAVLGSDSVHRSNHFDCADPEIFIPSGLPLFDTILDREGRGWPVGRIIEIYGAEATAKTGIAYSLIAAVQKMGGEAILYPAEGNVDHWMLERYGVDLDRLIIPPDPMKHGTVEGVFSSFRAALNNLTSDRLLVGVIDSVAGLSINSELTEDDIQRDRAAQVRAFMMSKAMRKIGAIIPKKNAILFCINQVRAVGDDTTGRAKPKSPGGMALKFYASIRIRLEMVEKIWRQKSGQRYVAGFKIKATAEKNRLARPYETVTVMLDFEKGLIELPSKGKKDVS
jgi:recombination protein RecA